MRMGNAQTKNSSFNPLWSCKQGLTAPSSAGPRKHSQQPARAHNAHSDDDDGQDIHGDANIRSSELAGCDGYHWIRNFLRSCAKGPLITQLPVMLYCDWSDDAATLVASLALPEAVAKEDFDSGFYVELLES
jgi:hypothetical protein